MLYQTLVHTGSMKVTTTTVRACVDLMLYVIKQVGSLFWLALQHLIRRGWRYIFKAGDKL